MIIQSLFLMIPCEFLNVNMCVRRKTRQFRNTHYYPGCHPLPSPLQLPLRTDQPPQAGADRGVEPVQGLWGPRPRGQRVKQRRNGIQVSRETIDKVVKVFNKVPFIQQLSERNIRSGRRRVWGIRGHGGWPGLGLGGVLGGGAAAESGQSRRSSQPRSGLRSRRQPLEVTRGHQRSPEVILNISEVSTNKPTLYYTSDKSTLWYQLALLLDHLIYTYILRVF